MDRESNSRVLVVLMPGTVVSQLGLQVHICTLPNSMLGSADIIQDCHYTWIINTLIKYLITP